MLSPDKKQVADRLFVVGEAAFDEAGWSPQQIREFVDAPETREYIDTLSRQFTDDESSHARALFLGRQSLQQMLPTALQIIADAMRGPEYLRGDQGEIVTDMKNRPVVMEAPPTLSQTEAAQTVMDRLGLAPKQGPETVGRTVSLAALLNQHGQKVRIDYPEGSNDKEQVVTRERVRNFIERYKAQLLPAANRMLEDAVSRPPGRTGRSPHRVRPRAKVVKSKVTASGPPPAGLPDQRKPAPPPPDSGGYRNAT